MSDPPFSFSPEEEQERLLQEGVTNVKGHSFNMKRALDKQHLQEALVFANHMLNELRTGVLSPQKYYSLYMQAFDEMTHLELFFGDEVRRGVQAEDLYEIVQHAGNIVPRMYLLITVGSVYIKSKQAPAKDILRDMVEMCKGVQHPTRGLFLRNYLSQIAKNKLPDNGNEYEGEGGTVRDSVDFILQNFGEMVRLWVRMESKAILKEKEKRDKERKELRVLVGYNLVRLSQLDGIDLQTYQTGVFDRMIEIIIQSKDLIAQQYLMESLVQVFPDEFHLGTLHPFLDACMMLHSSVDLKVIFAMLLDRLGNFASNPQNVRASQGIDFAAVLDRFLPYITRAFTERPKTMTLSAFAQTQISLLGFALKAFPDDSRKADKVLEETNRELRTATIDKDAAKHFKRLLMLPIEQRQEVQVIYSLEHFGGLYSLLHVSTRREVAVGVARAAVRFGEHISTLEQLGVFLSILGPLLSDQNDDVQVDDEDFVVEQELVARIISLVHAEDTGLMFRMCQMVRKQLGSGGERRMGSTLPAAVFSYLRLLVRVHAEGDPQSILPKLAEQVLRILDVLTEIPAQRGLALRLLLQVGGIADTCALHEVTVMAFQKAWDIYDEITDSKAQSAALAQMISGLAHLGTLPAEHFTPLSSKACQRSAKVLRKSEQCLFVLQCALLYWGVVQRDAEQAAACLQRAVKLVDACSPTQHRNLYVQILNAYIHQFQLGNPKIALKSVDDVAGLVSKEDEEAPGPPEDPTAAPVAAQLQNALKYIAHLKATDAKWKDSPQ